MADVFTNMRTFDFDGSAWVNLNREWPTLPDCIKAKSDKWRKRLNVLKIPYAMVRLTARDDIAAELSDASKGGRRTAWMPAHLWKTYVNAAIARKSGARPSTGGSDASVEPVPQSSQEEPAHADPEHAHQPAILDSPQVLLSVSEHFVYEGVNIRMRMYGERTHEGIYVDLEDITNAIGIRADHIPEFIIVQQARVGNELRRVLSYEMMITMICATAHNSAIAAELRKWITATIFTAHLGDGATVPQAVFAMRGISSYSGRFYGFPENKDKFECLYMIEACSAAHAAETHLDQIKSLVPEGRHIGEFCVVKRGCSLDGRTRTTTNRSTLKKIFPGCNPLPIHKTAFPFIDEADICGMESSVWGEDFEHRRIKGIREGGEEKVELYLLDAMDVHLAKTSMDSHAHQYSKKLIITMREEVTEAQRTQQQNNILQERLEARDRELCRCEKELARCASEIELERARTAAARTELKRTRTAALTNMPKETAQIASVFWGCVDS